MKKKILAAIVLIVLATALLVYFTRDPQKKIENLVLENTVQLEELVQGQLAGAETPEEYLGVQVEGVFQGENPIVQFRYSASGLGSSTTYYGFYYSPADEPAAFQNVDLPLSETEQDHWEWTDGTDNGGVTQKITRNWFYYEAWS